MDAEFIADPFLLFARNKWHLFFEVMEAGIGKGSIGLATSLDGNAWQYEKIVLRTDVHLSYPFVFHHKQDIYMIPETKKAREVRLYRAHDFPYDWRLERVLLRGRYADASVFQYGDRWWMHAEHGPSCLALFYAESPHGPWRRHRYPFVRFRDKGAARPAGRPIILNGRAIRFAQDSRGGYGRQVRAFTIHHLTKNAYEEHPWPTDPFLAPALNNNWNGSRMHHLDACQLGDGSWLAASDGSP